jgi:hypothetical protein
MTSYKIYLCGDDDSLTDPNPECARHDLHTQCPSGYVEFLEWCGHQAYLGATQSRCPGCDLYVVWGGGRTS